MTSRDLGADVARALARSSDGAGPQGIREPPEAGPGAPSRGPILVAWSGGLDSTVLLDLVLHDERVRAAAGGGPIAAHLDHAMRPDSAEAARALAATAAEWGVEFHGHRLETPPASEAEARHLRYAWLSEVADAVGADRIWTAHHADDQVETVLFRILRGTGVQGLVGIPARRDRIVRPFLLVDEPVGRTDLAAHAAAHGLPVRADPTNEQPIATRNRLRNEVLPLLNDVVPGARDALLRLARNAERGAAELDALVDRLLPPDGIPAELWARADEPLRRALLRGAARRMGVALSEAATAAAMDLPPDAQSGRGVDLPSDLRLEREFDRWRLRRSGALARAGAGGGAPNQLEIPAPSASARAGASASAGADGGVVDVGGRALRATWRAEWRTGGARPADSPPDLSLDLPSAAFPLTLRAWREGDRITLDFGTTAVAKAWAEARVPRLERYRRWVLVDRGGAVLAAEGLGPARSDDTIEGPPIRLHLRLDLDA